MERRVFSDKEVSVMGQCREHGKGRNGIALGTPKYNIEGSMERVKKARRSWLFFIIFPSLRTSMVLKHKLQILSINIMGFFFQAELLSHKIIKTKSYSGRTFCFAKT